MPISRFAEKIARTLVDYLVENPATLDTSALADTTQQVFSTLSSSISSSFSYYWSKPSPPSGSNLSGTTPPAQHSTRMGKAGLERAREIARIFKVVFSEPGLRDALSNTALIGGTSTRKTELFTEGFGLTQPGRILDNYLIKQDCDNIIDFILHEDDTLRGSKSGQKIMAVITTDFKIREADISEEVASLRNPEALQRYDLECDMPKPFQVTREMIEKYKQDEAGLLKFLQEIALRRLIYDKATTLKEKLANQSEWSTVSPRNSASANSNASSQNSARQNSRRGSGDDIFQMSPHGYTTYSASSYSNK